MMLTKVTEILKEKIDSNFSLQLPPMPPWPPSIHSFENHDDPSIWALKAALAAERPLLVRGEPGTGKSQLARAAAVALNRAFVYTVITARTEGLDMLWRFDAVGRLAVAQLAGTAKSDITSIEESKFVIPGPLWWALDQETAEKQCLKMNIAACPCIWKPADWTPAHGTVLLIDEIDKADADVPNSLLEVLGSNGFTVPHSGECVSTKTGIPAPLIIITTNEERELPWAFLRRCLVHHLALPKEKNELQQWLVNRGKAHFKTIPDSILISAADILIQDRFDATQSEATSPGQAEYLDMLRAVHNLIKKHEDSSAYTEEETGKATEILNKIKSFALNKKLLESPE
jgi:MoxR-like ATPase